MRARTILFGTLLLVLAVLVWLMVRAHERDRTAQARSASLPVHSAGHLATPTDTTGEGAPTDVYAHNLLLRKGPNFRAYILWMRGKMLRTDPGRVPSFDDASTFLLNVDRGVIYVQLADLARYLNAVAVPHAPVTNVSFTSKDGLIHLRGTAHKLMPMPLELVGAVSTSADERIHLRVRSIRLLKLPIEGLLGGLHLSLADLFHSNQPGIQVIGNDVIFDTQVLLPEPHIRGQLTSVRLVTDTQGQAIEARYGGANGDVTRAEKWHNFLQLTNGTLDFGKLTMHHVDLIMVDASKDPWFDLDLINYQAQLVHGITHMTPQAGLQIFMPNVGALPPNNNRENITMEWLKDRNLPPPASIPH